MGKTQRLLMGIVLFTPLMVLLGWYFWVSYNSSDQRVSTPENMLTPHDELFDIAFNASQGWIVGKYGLILHSVDGGKSWTVQESATTAALTAVLFVDDHLGFVVGSGGTILVTRDAGRSWIPKNSGSNDHLLGVHAIGARNVFVVGAFGTVLSSSDGGDTWRKQNISWDKLIPRIIKNSGYMEPNLNAVYFAAPNIGWIAGEFGLILHTRDGGHTWMSQRYDIGFPQIVAVKFLDPLHGWAIGQQGTFLRTSDGGKVWKNSGLTVTKDLYGISINGEKGIIVGDGIVLKTSDSSTNWIRSNAFPENVWLSGVALNNTEAVAVGQSMIRLIGFDSGSGSSASGGS